MRADRKAAKAREVCDLTVPAEHRSAGRGVVDRQVVEVAEDDDRTLTVGQRAKGGDELVPIDSQLRFTEPGHDVDGSTQPHFGRLSAQVPPAVLRKVHEYASGVGLRPRPGGVPPASRSQQGQLDEILGMLPVTAEQVRRAEQLCRRAATKASNPRRAPLPNTAMCVGHTHLNANPAPQVVTRSGCSRAEALLLFFSRQSV